MSSKSAALARCLYRGLLRSSKPFTAPAPNAVVHNCLLQRTGIDDHISDWEQFVSENPDDTRRSSDDARDLSVSFSSSKEEGNIPSNRTFQRLFRRLLREVVTGKDGTRKICWPAQVDTSRLRAVIKREFRNESTYQSKQFDEEVRIQVAFTALQELNKKLCYFEGMQTSSPEPCKDQAALNVSALPTSKPSSYLQPGAFLVSHPCMLDTFFEKTVVCILDHKAEPPPKTKPTEIAGQTYGFIVNRVNFNPETGKTQTLKEAFEESFLPGKLAEVFGESVVRDGGPIQASIQMMHSLLAEKDEKKIGGRLIPTIPEGELSSALFSDKATYFQGQIFKALNAVEDGFLDKDDVSFFVGASTWSKGQLEDEIKQGYWIPCRGPAEIAVTGQCEHNTTSAATPADGKPRPFADLWLSMLSACGDEESKLGSLFHERQWDENGLPCDSFADEEDEEYHLVF